MFDNRVANDKRHAPGDITGSDFEKQMIAHAALGRLGQPDDIAPVAAG